MLTDAEKLKDFRLKNNWTQQEFAEILGVKLSRISMVECGKNKLSLELKEIIKKKCNYDIDTGLYDFNKYKTNLKAFPIPFYHVKASANPDGDFIILDYGEDECLWFDERWLRNTVGVEPINCSIIEAKGDSMQPDIMDGDLLLIDNSDTTITNNRTYIIEITSDNKVLVKRVRKGIEGKVSLISNNKKYNERVLKEEDKAVIRGKVVYNLSRGNI